MAADRAGDLNVVIIGAGCFGLSTAYHLLQRGFTKVTVLDRSLVLPAPEAASTDINKIVRSSYADIFYAKLARSAIATWKDVSEWDGCYHESGVLVMLSGGGSYSDRAHTNDVALGAHTVLLPARSSASDSVPGSTPATPPSVVFPPSVDNLLETRSGYLNQDGGWVHASRGVELLMQKVENVGGTIVPGKAVVELVKDVSRKTTGVRCADGSEYPADCVVLAAGAWSASAFSALRLSEKVVATGQTVGKIQLTPQEADVYRDIPVYLELDSGFYLLPPNDQNVIKCGIHAAGFTHTATSTSSSTPIFPPSQSASEQDRTKGTFETAVPKAALDDLRAALADTFPELAAKPWAGTRLCWYTDSADEDFIIGFHPDDDRVMLATAGSGHALKFLPVLGILVADAIEGKMDPGLVAKFAFDREVQNEHVSRPGREVRELDLHDLIGA